MAHTQGPHPPLLNYTLLIFIKLDIIKLDMVTTTTPPSLSCPALPPALSPLRSLLSAFPSPLSLGPCPVLPPRLPASLPPSPPSRALRRVPARALVPSLLVPALAPAGLPSLVSVASLPFGTRSVFLCSARWSLDTVLFLHP